MRKTQCRTQPGFTKHKSHQSDHPFWRGLLGEVYFNFSIRNWFALFLWIGTYDLENKIWWIWGGLDNSVPMGGAKTLVGALLREGHCPLPCSITRQYWWGWACVSTELREAEPLVNKGALWEPDSSAGWIIVIIVIIIIKKEKQDSLYNLNQLKVTFGMTENKKFDH